MEEIRIHLGLCASEADSSPRAVPRRAWRHWAVVERVSPEYAQAVPHDVVHVCSTDHIADWPQNQKGLPDASLILSFAPSQINPEQYVLTRITQINMTS
ncbi:hypothetical protein OH76DRAFT_1199609 [Lentinus brumalis]|uniref:Uncharacterized protein n=1 Tax=Lentinus brumalis TaxID=2498619 RepID=A0A371CT27_9APHY|nr:hypothetical protein OH76DRAFT_1199609 [Polyporus brumalis]